MPSTLPPQWRPQLSIALSIFLLGACARTPAPRSESDSASETASASDNDRAQESNASTVTPAVLTAQAERVLLRVPPDSEIPAGPLGESVRRGRALFAATRDSLPDNVDNQLRCLSCHLDDGRRANASPLVGAFLRYPDYNARAARIFTIEDRINDCFRRSMAGRPLAAESASLRDMVAYLAFLSRGIQTGADVAGHGIPKIEPLPADTARGREIFASTCVRCHGGDGGGTALAPPLWGAGSFGIGAGMARLRTAASFIRHNMPYDLPGTLSDQQAFDVAAYVNSHSRPDLAGKENDWPNGDAPPDAAYPTRASKQPAALAARSR